MQTYKNKITGEIVERYNDYYYKTVESEYILKRFVENSNDWEEEKDYSILTFIHDNGIKISIQQDGLYSAAGNINSFLNGILSEEELLKFHPYKIRSVRRSSDGEIFKLGDVINKRQVIESIALVKGEIRVYTQCGFYKLSDIVRDYKKLVFKSHDGVNLYEGDYFWIVEEDLSFSKCKAPVHSLSGMCEERKYFSSKDAAEDYVLMNKECLSLNEILSVWGRKEEKEVYKIHPLFISIKKLAKEKLKQK